MVCRRRPAAPAGLAGRGRAAAAGSVSGSERCLASGGDRSRSRTVEDGRLAMDARQARLRPARPGQMGNITRTGTALACKPYNIGFADCTHTCRATVRRLPHCRFHHADAVRFRLPAAAELIAQTALPERSASRLLVVERSPRRWPRGHPPAGPRLRRHRRLLHPGDLLVFNDTARDQGALLRPQGQRRRVEALVERLLDSHTALQGVPPRRRPRAARCAWRMPSRSRSARAPGSSSRCASEPALDLIERYGRLPLPPYITHDPDAYDETRYQTVYARNPGAVAAPPPACTSTTRCSPGSMPWACGAPS